MISTGGILNLKAEVCWKTTLTLFPSASVPLTKRMNIVAQSIYFEDKAETSEPPNKKEEICHNQMENKRKKLELRELSWNNKRPSERRRTTAMRRRSR